MAGKRQKCGEDRLSNLPEAMISHILSFLPTESAVATTCLSKTWNLRWTKLLTTLAFDYNSWISRGGGGGGTVQKTKFHQFVNMVLLKHSAESIHKFSLKWYVPKFQPFYLNLWLYTVIARNVRVIDLAVCPDRGVEILPASLYSCGTLEVLKLSGCLLVKPSRVVYLPRLTVLELHSVRHGSDESFRKLISGCPRLLSLTIHRNYDDDIVRVYTIYSSTLKCLDIAFFYPGVDDLDIMDLKVEIKTPSLECLVLYDSVGFEYNTLGPTSVNKVVLDINDGIVGLVQTSDRLKFLDLSLRSMDGVKLSKAPNQLSTSFESITELAVEIDPSHWSCLLSLISCCVNLEALHLTKVPSDEESYRAPVSVPSCFSSSLKRVSFSGFLGFDDEMGMLKFILEHAPLLETVTLSSQTSNPFWSSSATCDQKIELLNEVLHFPRSSPTCKMSLSFGAAGCPTTASS